MLITPFNQFLTWITSSIVKSLAERLVGFKQRTFFIQLQCLGPLGDSLQVTYYICQSLCDKIGGKILLINQNHFSGFLCFSVKLKELALAYESYAGGIITVILIEVLNYYYVLSFTSWQQ